MGHATAAEVAIVPSMITAIQGERIELNVTIDPLGINIAGAQLNIEFNGSILSINSIKEGNLFSRDGGSIFFSNGMIDNFAGTALNIFGAILGHYSTSTQGTFIQINATVIGSSGVSALNMSNVRLVDPYGNYIPLILLNGTVIINEKPDITPPECVGNLIKTGSNRKYIEWSWTDPTSPDFASVMVYINGEFKTNVTKGIKSYKATGLTPNNYYTISTHTVDTSGNINQTWVNNTAKASK